MTYTERRIAKKMAENPKYRAAFEEEELHLAKELEKRQELMSLLCSIRKSQHMSQQQLAERMKVSQARISQLERGQAPLSVDSLLQMVELLSGSIAILTPEDIQRFGLEHRLVTNGEALQKAIA